MAVTRQLRHASVRNLFEIEPPAPDRLELEAVPSAATVASYVLTRAAERSWSAINRQLEQGGALFWISGGAGAGKTHFLNYMLALAARAGTQGVEAGRELTCALEVAGVAREYEVESYLLDTLAERFGADRRAALVWRELHGAAALNVALDAARRIGIRAITAVIDFSRSDYAGATGYFRTMAAVARNSRSVRFTVIAAGRGPAPAEAHALEVAPADGLETAPTGIQRARRLGDRQSVGALIEEFYELVDVHEYRVEDIFPFHPAAVRFLPVLAGPAPTVAAVARLARDAMIAAADHGWNRLIFPIDLMTVPEIRRAAETLLGDGGAEALAACHRLVQNLRGNERELAAQIIDTLALERAAGEHALTLAHLETQIPMLAESDGERQWTHPLISNLLTRLGASPGVAIAWDGERIRFEPEAARVPDLARFNSAIALARRFDPTLLPAKDAAELEAGLRRLRDAMSAAVESAVRTRRVLDEALAEAHIELPPEHARAIADYFSLAEGGTERVLEAAADPVRRDVVVETIASYERLAGAAEVVPRLRAMREYLDGTALRVSHQIEPGKDPQVAALETECQLLRVEMEPRVLLGALRALDALEARFQKFKWTYVQHYLGAHEHWRLEMNRLAHLASDTRRHCDALMRLNAIAALGPPLGAELASQVSAAALRVVRCELAGPLQPEVAPRCPSCAYTLGTASPRAELSDLLEQLAHALSIKFAALSESAIARIIREHDKEHRLEGFLKITQAAQTDALTRVLDERLARYLAKLLDENLGAGAIHDSRGSLRRFDRALKPPRLRSAPKPGAHN